MADMESALSILRERFPEATIGVDNDRPYARTEDALYGILFGRGEHCGDPMWERGPVAIVRFPGRRIDSHNYEIIYTAEVLAPNLPPIMVPTPPR